VQPAVRTEQPAGLEHCAQGRALDGRRAEMAPERSVDRPDRRLIGRSMCAERRIVHVAGDPRRSVPCPFGSVAFPRTRLARCARCGPLAGEWAATGRALSVKRPGQACMGRLMHRGPHILQVGVRRLAGICADQHAWRVASGSNRHNEMSRRNKAPDRGDRSHRCRPTADVTEATRLPVPEPLMQSPGPVSLAPSGRRQYRRGGGRGTRPLIPELGGRRSSCPQAIHEPRVSRGAAITRPSGPRCGATTRRSAPR
jgi:hypothetical protein